MEALLDLAPLGRMNKIRSKRRQGNDTGKRWLGRQPVIEALVCRLSFRKERVIERPIRELGFTVSIASWP